MPVASLVTFLCAAALSGFGLPLGVPPQPEDPLMARLAPPECVAYFSWSGTAAPQAGTANRLEQLLADKEMVRSGAELSALLDKMVDKTIQRIPAEPREFIRRGWPLVKGALLQPGMIYLQMKPSIDGGPPDVEVGIVAKVGDQAGAVQKLLDHLFDREPPGMLTKVKIDGRDFFRKPKTRWEPEVTFGIVGQYFFLGFGPNVVEGFLERSRQEPPAWLTEAQARLALARRSSIAVVNVRKILSIAAPPMEAMQGLRTLGIDRVAAIESVCGLDGDSFITKTLVRTEGPASGLFAPPAGAAITAADFADLPAAALQCHVVRIDVPSIFDLFLFLFRGPDEVMQPRGLEELEKLIGMKVRGDLLPSFGNKARIWIGTTPAPVTPPPVIISIDVKDRAKVAQAMGRLEAMATAQGGPRGPKLTKEMIGDVEVTTLSPPAPGIPPISWTVTANRLIITSRMRLLREILQKPADFQSLADSPEVAQAIAANPNASALLIDNSAATYKLLYDAAAMALPFVTQSNPDLGGELSVEMLPDPELVKKYLKLDATTVSVTRQGLEIQTRASAPLLSASGWTPIAVAALLPAVTVARGAARQSQSQNNLKQIAIALLTYEAVHKRFPPAYSVDKNGKPLHSWRTLILPYLEQEAVYNALKLDEPWDSEHNMKFLKNLKIATYMTPAAGATSKTPYQTIRTPDSIFPGEKPVGIAQIRDGMSNTIAVVETNPEKAVDWYKPDDYVPDPKDPVAGLRGAWPNRILAAFGDGSVQALTDKMNANLFGRLTDKGDGQVIGFEEKMGLPAPPVRLGGAFQEPKEEPNFQDRNPVEPPLKKAPRDPRPLPEKSISP